MKKLIPVAEAERTTPYGEIIRRFPLHPDKPVQTWNNKRKMWEVTHFMEDVENIVAEDLTTIPADCCLWCHKPIKPYTGKYYEKHNDDGFHYSFEWSEKNNCCEDCANEKSAVAVLEKYTPSLVETKLHFRDGQTVEECVYSDGSVIEEMTVKELAEKKLK
jgi:hypothetical protein